jgi:hypothetical protein
MIFTKIQQNKGRIKIYKNKYAMIDKGHVYNV